MDHVADEPVANDNDSSYRNAVMDVRRQVEDDGVHWDTAVSSVIGRYYLGINQITEIRRIAKEKYCIDADENIGVKTMQALGDELLGEREGL